MMKTKRLKRIAFLALMSTQVFHAQEYKKMMEDPMYNVYEVIQKGNDYFKNRDKGKGSGYKQFQRWIIDNEDVFYPSGDRTKVDPTRIYYLGKEKKQLQASLRKGANATTADPITESLWTEIGPFVELKEPFGEKRNGNGRIDAIWVNPSNDQQIYIGCRGGGLWTTNDGGNSWDPKTDDLGITGIYSMAVHPTDPNIIYISTNVGGSGNYSIGVFKTTNGGDSWSPTGYALNITASYTRVNKLLINPTNPSMLYAATSGGLIKTSNGFQTFETVLTGHITDIEFKPNDSRIVYATNKTDGALYRSTDHGASFSKTTAVASNPQVAVSKAAPNNVYFSGNKKSYKSTNSGITFIQGGVPDGERGQYGGFAVSDTDPNLIMNGSLDTHRSTNGGNSFSKVTNWIYTQSTGVGGNFVHADTREIEIVNGVIYLGTDGWLSKSTDGGISYEILTDNVGNHEIYQHGLGVSQSDDNTLVVGVQDNGTSIWYDGTWQHWKGGDGGTSMIDHSNKNVIYGSLYNGDFKRTDNGGLTSTKTDLGDSKPGTLPPLIQHPTTPGTIFLGEANGQIWKSTNKGNTWTVIGNLGVSNVVDEMAIAPSNPDYIYASVNNRIWRTTNGGTTWDEITSSLPNFVIKGIAIDYDDPNHVAVCFTGYGDNTKSYETSNGGASWTNNSAGLPNITTMDIVYDNSTVNGLYIATDVGVYYKDDSLNAWELFGQGLPNVVVKDLEIQHSTKSLYVGTWGRGVWSAELVGDQTAPATNFKSDKVEIYEEESISFTDTSTGFPTSWNWTFENGTPATSTEQNPTIVYNTAGSYKVTLTTTNDQGSNTKEIDNYITVNEKLAPIANFTVDKQSIFVGSSINFSDTSERTATVWEWTFEGGTPSTSSEQNPTITYDTAGNYKVTLTASNTFGSDTEEKEALISVTENSANGDLQAHYDLNNNLIDSSPYARELSVVGGFTPTFLADHNNNPLSAYSSPGSSGNYLENSYKGIGGDNPRTVTAWIKTTSAGSRKTIVSWGKNTGGAMFNVMIHNGNIRVEAGSSSLQNDDSTIKIDDDAWHHIAVSYDPVDGAKLSDVKIYIDGVYYANQPDSGDSFNSQNTSITTDVTTNNLQIGNANYSGNYFWRGALDDIRIYSKAITLNEINTIMNGGTLSNEEVVFDSEISIYPNPAKDKLTIETFQDHRNIRIAVYNILGELKKTLDLHNPKRKQEISLTGLTSGMYFLKLSNSQSLSKVYKIIKE